MFKTFISLGLAILKSLLCSYIWDEVLTYPRLALMNPWLSKYMTVELILYDFHIHPLQYSAELCA